MHYEVDEVISVELGVCSWAPSHVSARMDMRLSSVMIALRGFLQRSGWTC